MNRSVDNNYVGTKNERVSNFNNKNKRILLKSQLMKRGVCNKLKKIK